MAQSMPELNSWLVDPCAGEAMAQEDLCWHFQQRGIRQQQGHKFSCNETMNDSWEVSFGEVFHWNILFDFIIKALCSFSMNVN